jgi:hypothetical protein
MSKQTLVSVDPGMYWQGFITRAEAQTVNDEFAAILVGMQKKIIRLEYLSSFIAAKLGLSPEELEAVHQGIESALAPYEAKPEKGII